LIDKDSRQPFFYYIQAQNLAKLGKVAEAIEASKKAIELRPDFLDARIFLGRLYSAQEDHAEVIKIYRAVIEDDPKNAEAFPLLAREYIALDDYKAAIKVLRDYIKVDPDSVVAYYLIGTIYERNLKMEKRAIREYKEGLKISSADANIQGALAQLYFRKGDLKKALAIYEDMILRILKTLPYHFALRSYITSLRIMIRLSFHLRE